MAERQPVRVAELDVDERDVRLEPLHELDGFGAGVRRTDNVKALRAQQR